MTPNEVMKELQKDVDYIIGRMDGLGRKNNKKLNNKFVKHNEIMSVSTYVVPETHNTAVVYAMKYIQQIQNKDYATMSLSYYIKTCYNTIIIPSVDSGRVVLYVEFTQHSMMRINERIGRDFVEFFEEDFLKKNHGSYYPVRYYYNGDENEYVAQVGDAFLILEKEGMGLKYVVKTVLSHEELHIGQTIQMYDSKFRGEEFRTEMGKELNKETKANLKMLKKNRMVRGVA